MATLVRDRSYVILHILSVSWTVTAFEAGGYEAYAKVQYPACSRVGSLPVTQQIPADLPLS